MNLRRLSIVLATCVVIAQNASATSNIVISQVYGGGGNSSAAFRNDYVELFNRGTSTVSASGWSVQYQTQAGTTWTVHNITGSIAPGRYLLIQLASGGATGALLPTPDVIASPVTNLNATQGKIALVNSTTALTCSSNSTCFPSTAIVDLIGYGSLTTLVAEGPTTAPAPANNASAALRASGGCIDTDTNATDFSSGPANPRNSSSPANVCPGGNSPPTITAPANPITTVNQDAPPFTVALTGNDDGGIYNWSATPGTGVASVSVTGGQGTPNATFTVTLQAGFSGTASFTASLSDTVNPPATQGVNIGVTPTFPTLTINDVTQVEGNTGSTVFNFVVTLSSPALAGGVSFTIATQDNTATTADNDYVANTINATIPQGGSTFTFPVTVNADIVVEGNESFFVNVTNVAGSVSVVDSQGLGTITNDDFPPTPPSGVGTANPNSLTPGSSTLLTVTVTPGANPVSTGITVTGDLSAIGGAGSQPFFDDGTHGDVTPNNNVYSFSAAVPITTTLGTKVLPVTVADAQARSSSTTIALIINAPSIAPGTIVISQVYGGGGNSGAILKNDFVELFNRTNSPVLLDGWSLQFAGATASFSGTSTPLSGVIQPYSYFLVKESQGAAGSVDLPPADVTGVVTMGAASGKVALVSSTAALSGGCPTGAQIIDFIGYGNASCAEGVSIGLLSNTTAAFRKLGGCRDNNTNSTDFFVGSPAPRNSASPINDCSTVVDPGVAPHMVISQIYAGGGNQGAVYANDFVELHNPTSGPVNLNDWSIQYTSATGNTWGTSTQPLGGILQPGEYLLIQLGAGTEGGLPLPSPRIIGTINMAATSGGKLALVNRVEALSGNCPVNDPAVIDFLGYGAADCYEGGLNAPVASNNTQAVIRVNDGNTDTNQNSADFVLGAPNPRGGGPLIDLVPRVTGTDPIGPDGPRDASVTVNFSESVTVSGTWYNISCATSGVHSDAEVASAFTRKTYIITPNVTFVPGETCTVQIFHSLVLDEDGTPDTLPADVQWTFAVAIGAVVETADVHLALGNPSGATINDPDNFLMSKPEFALSYNRNRGTANWVSWHLTDAWTTGGSGGRTDDFRPDPAISPTWYRVLQTDYSGSGFDRGHMSPSADRTTNVPINQATFLMTNMVPQSPDNNQGPWEAFESFLRTLLPANEIYIISGPDGTGGSGANGFMTTLANGHVTVPTNTWKVVLVLPKAAGDDIARVTAATTTIAIRIPNVQLIRNNPWQNYLTTVRAVEQVTGYNFFSNVPRLVQNCIERGINGVNPPCVADQSFSTSEDTAGAITLNALSPTGAPLTYTISSPAHGTLSGTGANQTYTPAPDFNGSDNFTFSVSDGIRTSTTGTVTINVTEVNDPPVPQADNVQAEAAVTLTFPESIVTANDSPGPADEAGQTLHVASVAATANTHGTVFFAGGQISYTSIPFYIGPASFTYQVCDNGTTNGAADAKCSTGTVNVTVGDTTPPVISDLTLSNTVLWPPNHQMVNISVNYTVTDAGDPSPTCTLSVTSNEPVNGLGDGDTSPDWNVIDAHHVQLRAERAAGGNGRIYTIEVDCRDRFLNLSQMSATVTAPKSNNGK